MSTNLGPWVNRRGIFDRHTRNDVFRDAKLASAQRWGMSPKGQHIELGIAEQNLFLLLGAAGLTPAMTGARLLPVGTVYDPFVNRGLDALIYACYQDARFLLVSTPSGLTLAPEGGQHQSVNTPLIGMAADRLASFEPAHVDELAILLRHAFDHHAAAGWFGGVAAAVDTRSWSSRSATLDADGGDRRRALGGAAGARARGSRSPTRGRWRRRPRRRSPSCRRRNRARACWRSPRRTGCMPAGWRRCARGAAGTGGAVSHIETLLAPLAPGAALVTVLDGHPATHAWLGAVRGQRVVPLGPDHFGQSGDIPGSVPRVWHGYGRDPGRLRAGAAGRVGAESAAHSAVPNANTGKRGCDRAMDLRPCCFCSASLPARAPMT